MKTKNLPILKMKPQFNLKIFILLFLLASKITNAQLTVSSADPGRGLYVNNFFNWINSSLGVDRNNSILGVVANEDALLNYCKQNHITHIVLYDVDDVIGNMNGIINPATSATETVSTRYCNFLARARSTYGISRIGVAGSSATFFSNVASRPSTPPIIISDPAERTSFSSIVPLLENTYVPTDPDFGLSEYLKFFVRATNTLENVSSQTSSITCPADQIDAYVIELEFWNNNVQDGSCAILESKDFLYSKLQNLLTAINAIRETYNDSHARQLYVEVYLGNLDAHNDVNGYTYNSTTHQCEPNNADNVNDFAQSIVNYLTNQDPISTTVQVSNRNFAAYYNPNPEKSYKQYRPHDYYDERLLLFNNQNDPLTKPSEYHPLFSAGSKALNPNSGGNYFGYWFKNLTFPGDGVYIPDLTYPNIPLVERNIFRAEKCFYDGFLLDNFSNPKIIIRPGGFQWFASEYMVGILDNARIFNSNSPVCSTGALTPVAFTYQGPLESGISWQFKVVNNSTGLPVFTMDNSSSATGTGTYTNNLFVDLNGGGCNLAVGNYTAELSLDYEFNGTFSADYIYQSPVNVVSTQTVEMISPSGQGTSVCEGGAVILKANSNTSGTYQWYNSSGFLSGETSQYLSITTPGVNTYYCQIGGTGCAGQSNNLTVTVKAKPVVTITSAPSTLANHKCEAILTAGVTPASGTETYKWFEGTASNSISVLNDAEYSVIVTDNGCSTKSTFTYLKFQTSSASTIGCLTPPQSSATVIATNGTFVGAPYTYSWNTTPPQTNATATNLPPGTYTCRITNSNGCFKDKNVVVTALTPPSIGSTISPASTVCSGQSITLNGTGGDTYSWSNGVIDGVSFPIFTTQNYSVTGTDADGCENISSLTITVNSIPFVSIAGLSNVYCKNSAIVTLTGNPAGGTFTIDGNNATSLDPAFLTSGTHIVVYSYNDGTCSNTATKTVQINDIPLVSITGLINEYCKNATPVTLIGSPSGGSFTIDGNSSNSLDPSNLTTGNHNIVYSYNDGTCSNTVSQTVQINDLPVVSITGLSNSYCKNASVFTLAGSPSGGTFTIDGNNSSSLDPSTLTTGNHNIVYSYNDGTCSNTASKTVQINELPVVSITGLSNSYCKNASVFTLAGSPSGGTFTIDGNSATFFDPSSLSTGNHNVDYLYNDGTCSNSATKTVQINALPIVSIAGLANEYCKNAAALTLGGSPTGGTFSIDGNNATSIDPASLTVGTHNVVYLYYDGTCDNSAQQNVLINDLPTVSISQSVPSPFCESSNPLVLNGGAPVGGAYSGTSVSLNISNYELTPLIGTSSYPITYTYTDPTTTCSNIATQTINYNILTPQININASITNSLGEIPCEGSLTNSIDISCLDCPTVAGYNFFIYSNLGTTATLLGTLPAAQNASFQLPSIGCGSMDGIYAVLSDAPFNDCFEESTSNSIPVAVIVGSGHFENVFLSTVNATCSNSGNGSISISNIPSDFININTYSLSGPNTSLSTTLITSGSFTIGNLSTGNYTLNIPYKNSSGITNQIDVDLSIYSQNVNPVPNIIRTPDSPCNNLLSTSLYSNHEWRLSGSSTNLFSSTTSSSYSPTSPGNYTVMVTDGNGCKGTSVSKKVIVGLVPLITTGSDITCEINNNLYTATVSNYSSSEFTSSWTVPTGVTKTQSGNTITITNWGTAATTGGTISCTVTNACGQNATTNFSVKGCCSSPTTADLNNKNYTSSPVSSITGTINLNGTLNISKTGNTPTIVEFDGANVSISKGSKILVASGCTLKINNSSYLHACSSDLWDGIVLEDGARIEINDSRIDDAYTAVYCNKTSSYSIISSIFNNNNTAVFIHGTSINSLVDGYVRNSVFTARSLTGSPTIDDLKSTNNSINLSHYTKSTRKGYVGIDVENIGKGTTPLYNLKIGDESYSYANGGNVFDNHDYGVRIKNSNVEVVNNKFQEMEGYDKPPVSRGIGVWASQDGSLPNHYSIKVGGYATNEKNTFTDCGIGTLINAFENAIVVKNLITKTAGVGSYSATNYNGRMGIKFTNSGISNYDCSTNTISNIYRGIEWVQSEAKHVTCNFSHNNISTSVGTEDCYSAISLLGPQNYDVTSSTIYIERNTITNVWNGIRAENFGATQDFSIRGNTDILIRKNSGGTAIQSGIFAQRCMDIKITDNSSIRSSSSNNLNLTGIYLSNSNRAKIDCNTISSIGTCIALNGYSSGRADGVVHKNVLSDYKIGLNIYPNAQANSVGSITNSADNQWNNSGGRLDIQCLSTQSLDIYLNSTASPYKPNAVYGYAGYSYSTASANSNATCNSTGTSVAVSKILTSEDIILLRMLAEGLIDYTVLAPETKWLYAGIAYNMLMKDSTLSPSDTILGNFLDSLQNTNIGKFYSIDEAIDATNWSQAESDNQSISAQNHIEVNLKKYNNYYLAYRIDNTLATDSTWLADMVSDLGPIAAECYSTGGPATPSARMLLSYFTNQIFNEGDDCYKTPLDSIIADSANSVCDRIKQYSVPASASVTYTWTVPSGASFTQSSNTIDVNWGSTISTGGTITCSVMDTLGNSSYASYTEDSLTTAPSCPTVTANNTSCVTATSLSWTASGCAAGYQVTLWTGTGTPNYVLYMQDIGYTSTFALPVLSPTTTYYYQIVPYDYHDSVYSACSTNSFTSGASQAVSPTLTTTITLGAESVTTPALPCGTLVENYDGLGTSSWYTSTTAPRTGSNHMRIDKNPDNTTNLDDWFFSPPINVTAGKAYRVTWYDRIASGTTMEYFSVYFGVSSADASTMTGATPGFNGMANSTTYHKDSATDFLATSTGQIYFGFRATSPHNQGSLYIDDIEVKEMQVTALTSGSCNTTLSSSNTINVTAVTGATNYQYKFVGTGGQSGYNYTHGTFNSATSFDIISKAPGVIYGYTYNVSASFKKNNVWSPFGVSCPVTLSAFPQNKLADNPSTPGYCAYTVTDQHDLIGVTTIPGASKYQYKIIENDTTNSYVYDTTSTTFNAVGELRLDMTTISPKVRYDYYYNVQVRGLVGSTNSTYGSRPGVWGTYGQTCIVHVSGKPTTSLTSTYCNTNLTTLNDVFYITPISSASIYRYHITASGYDNTIATSNSNTDFRLTLIPTSGSPGGVKYGTVYTIEAAAYVGGEWLPYGSSCTLTTPTAPTTKLQTSDCNISISSGATSLHWNSIYGASNYQYKVSGDYSNGYRSHEVYRNNALTDFHLSQANQSGSTILANKTYYVQVRYYAGQWEAYGDSCSITTNSNYSRYLDSLLFEESKLSILSMNVFPNPNSYLNEFSVEFDGLKESNQKVDLSIFNTLGKSVYHAKIVTKEETQFVIKPDVKLPPGLYVIMGEVNGERLQRKFVVD